VLLSHAGVLQPSEDARRVLDGNLAGISELDAAVMKDGLVRAETLPLVFKALGCESLARGTRVRVRITGSDALTLELHANLLARLDDVPTAAVETTDEADDGADDLAGAAPLALAIDVDDAAPAEAPAA
jgi:exoribonuclease-2